MRSLLGLIFIVSSGAAVALACGVTANVDPATAGADGGSSGGPGVVPDGGSNGLPCDVDAILETACRKCHAATPLYGAPMPLATLADLHAPAPTNAARKVLELVPERVNDDAKPMPEAPNARLSAADRATLAAWVANGAPAGTTQCTTTPVKPDPPTTTCKPDLPIGPAVPYTMPTASGDEYVCYGVELSRPSPTHVVGFAPRIDNKAIVHHVVLFEADQAYSTTPTPCSAGGSLQWRMVTGWAPGGMGFELPPQAGFPLKTTGSTHYVVQMHYSNPTALVDQKDTSGFDLCTSAPRQYEADVMAFGTQKIDIAVNETKSLDCLVPVKTKIAGYDLDFTGLHLIASMPHMHKLGTEMSTQLLAGGPSGAPTDLGTIAGWSFNTQAWLPIQGDGTGGGAVLQANDMIKTRCTWKNTTGKPVKFGENTEDEMCYSFTTYYPRINAPIWSWAAPALTSTCQ
jgi:cytochrome c551/c552